ncbi:M48 family metalloprotease [Anatilimnocola floriformis]|uniref:M48 family metalloprotease n=1 Tax=Anatilimnocola floriformis TaxID=2948575 RepID=UPI0020C50460|nr:M48 family metalloprotease [Anatilimnocola floriformis]
MQLIILAALLATLAHSEAAPASATAPLAAQFFSEQGRLIGLLLTMLAAPFATACDGGWFIARLRRNPLTTCQQWSQAAQRYERLQLAAGWLWLSASLAVIYLWDWPALVRITWGWNAWPLVDDLLVLAPVVGSLVLVWITFYYVEQTAQKMREATEPRQSLIAYLAWQCRHYLAMALVPALVVLGVQDFGAYFGQQELLTATSAKLSWLGIPVLASLVIALPLLLRRLWPTSSLPTSDLRTELEAISQRAKTPLTQILVWETNGRLSNAAVAGLSRYCRYLFLTDALLAQLAPTEIAAVVRHELAHLQRRHLILRLLLLTLPGLAWFAFRPLLGDEFAWLKDASPNSLLVAGIYLGYAAVVVGYYSKLLEYDADLAAVFDDDGSVNADCARDLIHALAVLQGPHGDSSFSWLHPPTSRRIAWLRRVLMKPSEGISYRRKLDRVAQIIVAVTAGLIGMIAIASLLV